ncbi:MAG: trehalose-6-phosphate synthase [Candidatus Omnitrophica bacterium]|nr:trehalose-6-phosphate synthase [Candidatus Omnitrophota bacterium]MBU3933146.1 trehalose-6-phosphate synthase [Candidatus Omnitrophota bacterium]MBU4141178.1 trehalose-6-phosphate synthase [Candidatus Omnitrophota bacterium]
MVSNREPYLHYLKEGKIAHLKPAGGAAHTLDSILQACGGTWVAYGSGNADRKVVDEQGKIGLPPEEPAYTLKRLWLNKEQADGYYYGFSNQALWPLCHFVYTRPIFRQADWNCYQQVNKMFAEAVLKEIGQRKAFVWIQDYHLALLARYIKEKRKDVICAQFWHIPWPNPEAFRVCPMKKEILQGLLANDMLGFHVRYYGENFISTVEREIEARIDKEKTSIICHGRETIIRAFPISVDFQKISKEVDSQPIKERAVRFKEEFSLSGDLKIIFGLDRIDYTKGIPERLRAVARLLEKYPQYKERFVFIQIGALSRVRISQYRDLNDEINDLVEEINWKYSTENWSPIIFVRKTLSFPETLAFYRLGDVCIVSSLHDGMNIVAKEYICAKNNLDGMLLLSRFTGAARELPEAVLINPYDIEDFADRIKQALEMPEKEKAQRMAKLRETVADNDIYKWADKFISELAKTLKALRRA